MNQPAMMFLNCPADLDPDSAVRCGLPAEVRCRFTMYSTDGPLESVMIRCPAGHCFSGPVESLTPASRDPGLHRGHDRRDGSALRAVLAAPERKPHRPNTAPAYYLGHPANLWITVMRPRRERAASRHLMEATVGAG
jgi:hypothetical protein